MTMTTDFFADVRPGVSAEDLRVLKCVRDQKVLGASVRTLTDLIDNRLVWIGPPPERALGLSYRGRKALRDAEEASSVRSLFASALRRRRSAGNSHGTAQILPFPDVTQRQ